MKIFWKAFLIFILFPFFCGASPWPAGNKSSTGTLSIFQTKGFSLDAQDSHWKWRSLPSPQNEVTATFDSPDHDSSLKVQTETLASELSLESYAHQWMKDYAAYGFDVLGTKAFAQGNAKGYVIDLYHRSQKKELRQVVFLRQRTAVILTCSPGNEKLSQVLTPCNSIVKSFHWLQ